MSKKDHLTLLRVACLLFCATLVLGSTGCSVFGRWLEPRWHADFDSAETSLRKSDKSLLIRFVDPKPGRPNPLDGAFAGKAVSQRITDYVCCRLYKSYEPDRRYVGQYGVQRAPAVIVVHPDQTYHARVGTLTADELLSFLDDTGGPGAPADLNPHILRSPIFDWHEGFSAVEDAVAASGRPGFVIVFRRFTPDLRMLKSMIETHEVYARVADMVHGRVAGWNRWARTHETPFGEVRLPAIVLIHPQGGHEVLEMPGSSGDIARFADRFGGPREQVQTEAQAQAGPTASVLP